MINKELTKSILEAVDTNFSEQIKFTKQLMEFRSVRGYEQEAQNFVHDTLQRLNYKMDKWSIDINEIKDHPGYSPVTVDYSNAINVVGTHQPKNPKGKSLILNAHIDVVPEGPLDMWTNDPYKPIIDGDWLYGRGGADMKAGLAANIHAMEALKSLGYQPAAPVFIQSVTEEECTGNGALSCLVRGYTAEAAIIPEPEDDKLIRGNTGVLWFKVNVKGVPVHVREAGAGQNAIEACYPIIEALRELETLWNNDKNNHEYFKDLDHPINFNVGKIEGGDWASSVPAWCSFDCRIAIYPGWNPKKKALEIEDCIRNAAMKLEYLTNNPPEVEWNGFFAEGYILEEGSDAELTLSRAHMNAYNKPLETMVTPGYLDARVFILYDDCPCLVYGPYSENIHGFDERVSLNSVKRITGSIALFIAEWCKLEKI